MMLAKIGKKEILSSGDYIFEPKLDGYRAICVKKGDDMRFFSRSGIDITKDFPELRFVLKRDCMIDGEIVMFDEKGNPSFSMIQRRSHPDSKDATYVVFDVIELENMSVRHMGLEQRRTLLTSIVEPDNHIQIIPSTTDGMSLWAHVTSRNLEGVVAKRKNSRYIDSRTSDWLKIKNELTVDCIIVGYKTKVRKIASLSLGLYDKGQIRYIGQVGTGFSSEFLKKLETILSTLKKNVKKDRPIGDIEAKKGDNDAELPKDVTRVAPQLVCEVKYLELTKDHRLRAPAFIRLRDDKDASDCTMDQVMSDA